MCPGQAAHAPEVPTHAHMHSANRTQSYTDKKKKLHWEGAMRGLGMEGVDLNILCLSKNKYSFLLFLELSGTVLCLLCGKILCLIPRLQK